MISMEIAQNIEERLRDCRKDSQRDLGQEQSTIGNNLEEENPDWSRPSGSLPGLNDPHKFG